MSDRLVPIFKGREFEAELVKGRLEANGVAAMIMNNSMSAIFSTYSIVSGGVTVLIHPQDEERAKQILADE